MNEKDIAQRIKDLRTSQHLTLEQVANEVGVGKSTVRKWETGIIVNMRRDKIASLAKALHTTPAYLMGWAEVGSTVCPICGLQYVPYEPEDIEIHEKNHQNFLAAEDRFGVCYPSTEWEDIKQKCHKILDSNKVIEEKVDAAIQLFKVYFSRSLNANGYNLRHPSFNNYCAMLLNDKDVWQKRFGKEIYNRLVDIYGRREGIDKGKTICKIADESNNSLPDDAYPYNPVMHRIPILGTISAGLPLYAEQNIEGYTYTDLNGGEEYFALRVKGDSMNAAQINNGNILIVRKQNTVENGEIAVIMVDDEDAVVKRFYQNGDSVTLVPQSTNPQYLPQIYDLKKTKIKIIGKVMRNQIDF